jgi:two-component sensor histidine kinase
MEKPSGSIPVRRGVSFGPFRLYAAERLLEKDGAAVPLGSRALDLLTVLVERAGEVVGKRELLARAWPRLTVEESNLRFQISGLRRVLGESASGRRYIANVPGCGYCFVAPTALIGLARPAAPGRRPQEFPRRSFAEDPGTEDRFGLGREEIHHRFLNTLTTLRGRLWRDFAAFPDPGVQEAVRVFEGQLTAFAGLHRSLRAASAGGDIDVPTHFARLCAEFSRIHLAPHGHRCEFSADDGEIAPEACDQLGLILAELMTNCAKHAFRAPWRGRVRVAFRRWEWGWTCVVRDNGCGLQPGRTGEGLRLVQDLARAVQAEVAFHSDDDGLRVIVRLPDADLRQPRAPAVAKDQPSAQYG